MNIEEAIKTLQENNVEITGTEIYCNTAYLYAEKGKEYARLDGDFDVNYLEAIVTWMKSK